MDGTQTTETAPAYVKTALLRYIVPFWIKFAPEYGFADVCKELDREDMVPVTVFEPWHHIYEYIITSLTPGSHSAPLGRAWEYRRCELPEGRIGIECPRPKTPLNHLRIAHISLVLFTTGVGFLWYEVNCDSNKTGHLRGLKLPELLWLQQHLSTAQKETYPILFTQSGTKQTPLEWAGGFLRQQLGDKVCYFENRDLDGATVPYRMLHFADAVIYGENQKPLVTRTCQLARGFGYASTPGDKLSEQFYNAFEHTYINIGREGCAYIADEDAPPFSRENFLERFEKCYFWIYLLMLQQSYALKLFARRIAQSASDDPDADTEDTNQLLLEITAFLVRNEFASVSDIHHINGFYRYGLEQLNIKEESAVLHDGLDALTQLQNSSRRIQETQREKKSDERLESALALLALLAVISAVCDSVGIITGILDESLKGVWWIPVLLMWLLVGGIVYLAVRLFMGRDLPHIRRRSKVKAQDAEKRD